MTESIQRYHVSLTASRPFDGSCSGKVLSLPMPAGAHVLSMRCEHHTLVLLVRCDLDKPMRRFGVYLTGAGQAMPGGLGAYIGSFRDEGAGELHAFAISGDTMPMEALT